MRNITEQECRGLKIMVAMALKMVGGGACFQHITRVNEQALSKYGSPSDDLHMGIDIAVELDRAIGAPTILRHMAGLLGYELKAKPRATGQRPTPYEMSAATSECFDVFRAWSEGMEDGDLDVEDCRRIQREIQEAIRALTSISDGFGRGQK